MHFETGDLPMRIVLPALAALILSCTAAFATQDSVVHHPEGVDYAVPVNSPVKFQAFGKVQDTGRTALARVLGRLRADRYLPLRRSRRGSQRVRRRLRARTLSHARRRPIAARLPYWKDRGTVQRIVFSNEDAFIAAVIPAAARADLKAHRIKSVSGRVSLDVDQYSASVECDSPDYRVRFVKVHTPGTATVAQNIIEPTEC